MRKKLLLIGALALLSALNVQARIGYTLKECVRFYKPKPTEVSTISEDALGRKFVIFSVGDVMVSCYFINSKVAQVVYERPNGDLPNLPFSPAEAEELYARNGGSSLKLEKINWIGDSITAKNKNESDPISKVVISDEPVLAKAEAEKTKAKAAKSEVEEIKAQATKKAVFDNL